MSNGTQSVETFSIDSKPVTEIQSTDCQNHFEFVVKGLRRGFGPTELDHTRTLELDVAKLPVIRVVLLLRCKRGANARKLLILFKDTGIP